MQYLYFLMVTVVLEHQQLLLRCRFLLRMKHDGLIQIHLSTVNFISSRLFLALIIAVDSLPVSFRVKILLN